ncbi:hypothetical protein F2Q69_00027808 [Brassica cretica]|uniref:Uncharacterized protein n=1 Tax=Brassica cretica TaxID=69181 RepID=A0A8S9RTS0_BRACR|nr:hypothetical protein F2Q69_00027808 [Brassica cretica]
MGASWFRGQSLAESDHGPVRRESRGAIGSRDTGGVQVPKNCSLDSSFPIDFCRSVTAGVVGDHLVILKEYSEDFLEVFQSVRLRRTLTGSLPDDLRLRRRLSGSLPEPENGFSRTP